MIRIRCKSASDLEGMRESGWRAAQVLDAVARAVRPGVTTRELDAVAREEFDRLVCRAAFLGYRGFPASICVSVNEEVVHGIPGSRILQPGDLVSLDVGVEYQGWFGDTARTVMVGVTDPDRMRLVRVTETSLERAIEQAVEGRRLSDVSRAVQTAAEAEGFSVVREFVGHGIGRKLHEEPQVPNFVESRIPEIVLRAGMTLAIEPMINMGSERVEVLGDGWTVVTGDRKPSAHVEHTVAVGVDRAEILTRRKD